MQPNEPLVIDALAAEIDARLQALPGSKTEPVRAVRREYSGRLARASAQEVIALALLLLEEHRFVAYELVYYHRDALRSLGERELELFGRDMASWEAVDTFACYLSGPAWRTLTIAGGAALLLSAQYLSI